MRHKLFISTTSLWIVAATVVLPASALTAETYEVENGFYRLDLFPNWHSTNEIQEPSKEATRVLHIHGNSQDYDPDMLITGQLEKQLPFDETVWKLANDNRAYMLKSLLRSHPIIGMNRTELHALLGEPDGPKKYSAPRDRSAKGVEFYRLAEPFGVCVISGPHYCTLISLEVSYANERIKRFRVVISKFGHSQKSGVNPFKSEASK